MPVQPDEYLRSLKEATGLSLDRIVDRSGVPRTTIANYLAGTVKSPSRDTLRALVESMGGSMSVLDAPEESTPERNDDDLLAAEVLDRLQTSFSMSLEQLRLSSAATIADKNEQLAHERREKRTLFLLLVIIFVLLIGVFAYAVYAYTHFDVLFPDKGLSAIIGG